MREREREKERERERGRERETEGVVRETDGFERAKKGAVEKWRDLWERRWVEME